MRDIDEHAVALVSGAGTTYATRHRAIAPGLQRVQRGVYAPPDALVGFGERLLAARAELPPDAVLAGTTALWVHGADLARPADRIETASSHRRRVRTTTLRVARGRTFHPEDVQDSPWGLVTTPARTAYDLARDPLLERSVPRLDALARATTLGLPRRERGAGVARLRQDVRTIAARNRGARWITRVPMALDLLDHGAESPRESELRVVLALQGLPRLVTQHEVHDVRGRFVARLDLARPDIQAGIEYDGAHHRGPEQRRVDRARLDGLHACGWRILVVDDELFRDREALVAASAAHLRRATPGAIGA